jgi:uncharacterized membrane protein YqjE
MNGIPRVLAIILFVLVTVTGLVLGIINFFAPKFGLERDLAITSMLVFVVGAVMGILKPKSEDSTDDQQSETKEVEEGGNTK